jgi:uncharacterized protein YqeY
MSLHQDIKNEVKVAMLSKDPVRLNAIRGLVAAFTNELVAKKRKPTEELTDDEVLEVIRRGVKQRRDSIEQFRKGGREDLASNEEAELVFLQVYLPKTMSKDEIRVIAESKKAELGVTDKTGLGKLMGAILKDLKNKAESSDVKEVVDDLLK